MIKIFEAFAGYGTATFALKQLGIEHELVGFSEIDKYAIQCFMQNHGSKNYGSITEINWSEVPDFDLLTGGFPCQSFSVAGKGLGHLDDRGVLANYLTKALIVKQPRFFMFENVKGFMSKRHKEFRETLFRDWRDAGYKVFFKVLNTKDFGVPQNRERVFIVGFRNDVAPVFPSTFNFPVPFELKLKLKDLLEDEVDEKYFLRDEQVAKILAKGSMRNRCMQNGEFSGTLLSRDYKDPKCIKLDEITKGVSQAQRIFNPNGVGCTLRAVGGGQGAKTGLYAVGCAIRQRDRHDKEEVKGQQLESHGKEFANSITSVQKDSMALIGTRVRKLTPKECFRLQGFLKDEVKFGTISKTKYILIDRNNINLWETKTNVVSLLVKEKLKQKNMGTYTSCIIKEKIGQELQDKLIELDLQEITNVNFVMKKLVNQEQVGCVANIIKCGDSTKMLYTKIIKSYDQKKQVMQDVLIEEPHTKSLWKLILKGNYKKEKLFIISMVINLIIQGKIFTCVKQEANIQLSINNLSILHQNLLEMELLNLKMEFIESAISDTQKYRLAGNGQSVNVVKLLFKELLKND